MRNDYIRQSWLNNKEGCGPPNPSPAPPRKESKRSLDDLLAFCASKSSKLLFCSPFLLRMLLANYNPPPAAIARGGEQVQPGSLTADRFPPSCHCEEASDEAISWSAHGRLLHSPSLARNDTPPEVLLAQPASNTSRFLLLSARGWRGDESGVSVVVSYAVLRK